MSSDTTNITVSRGVTQSEGKPQKAMCLNKKLSCCTETGRQVNCMMT